MNSDTASSVNRSTDVIMNSDTAKRITQSDVIVLANDIQKSANAALILETLEFLRLANLDGDTLRASRIAAIVHALTKRDELGTNVHELASELINEWKTVVAQEHQQPQTQEQHSQRDVEMGEQEPLKTEICIESNESKTTWTFARLGSCSSYAIFCRVLPLLTFLGTGIYMLATASDVGYGLLVFGVCFLCAFCVIAMYVCQYGDSSIVFDDDAQMIYMEEKMCCNKRWCACCSSVDELGPYSQFERCFIETHTGGRGEDARPPEYTVELQFKEGENVRNKHTTKGDQRAKMICVAEEINAWWSTQSK